MNIGKTFLKNDLQARMIADMQDKMTKGWYYFNPERVDTVKQEPAKNYNEDELWSEKPVLYYTHEKMSDAKCDRLKQVLDPSIRKHIVMDKGASEIILDTSETEPGEVVPLPSVVHTLSDEEYKAIFGSKQEKPEYAKGIDNAPYTYKEQDPSGKSPNSPGAKLDAGKNRPWLFFKGYARALKAVSEVTTAGAKKYTPNGWKTVENGEERYMDAFMRHLFDVALDKKYDDGEGGIGTLHMAQVIWNLLSVLELQLEEEEQVNGK